MRKASLSLILCAALVSALLCTAGCRKDEKTESSPEPVATVTQPEKTEPEPEPETDIGEHKDYDKENAECYESGSIIVVSQDGTKRGMEPYTMTLGTGCLEFYANELNTVKELVGTKVRVYSMIVPSACELYCPANERYRIDSQEDIISDVKDMLVGVEQVDVLPTLRNHNAEDIYYRTDSRWTPLGAYYAGKAFARAAGVDYADISEYNKTAPKDYVGDLQSLCYDQAYTDLNEHPDKFSYYAPSARFTTNYYDNEFEFSGTGKFYEENETALYEGYYKGGFYCLRLDTKVKNGRKLLIVKDEFGTNFPTFLTSSFEQIYVVSYNYLSANLVEMIQDFGITDVLYLMNTYTVTDTRVYTLESLRSQATHGSLKDNAPSDTDSSDSDTDSSDTEKGSDSDSDTSDVTEYVPEYIYDVGINNQVGIAENSDEDGGDYVDEQNDGGDDYENDYDDYGDDGYGDDGYEE